MQATKTSAARLAGFAAVLLLVFGAALAAGAGVGPDRDGASREHSAPDSVRGLAVSDDGLQLALERSELRRGRPGELAFRILDGDGAPVRDFDVEHDKRMHTIVVRRDGRAFQHLHPELGADGVWRVPVTLPDAGAYRVYADFSHDGERRTLAADLAVDGEADYRPLPEPARTTTTADGYRVRLEADASRPGEESELRFAVTRAGAAVDAERYLGAGGHLVALREGDLAYLHVHPDGDDGEIGFMTEFPSAGRYRLYLQFKHAGRVHTAELTRTVAR